MPAPPETMRTSAVQRRSDFRKKVFGPPILRRSKRGANVRSSQKPYFRKSRRQLHPAVSDLPKSQIRARSASQLPKSTLRPHACAWDATHAMLTAGRARGRAHGDPHRWRRRWHVWIRSHMQPIAPRCGCDSGVGYDLRKWRGWSMRSILDHGETPAGVCRLPRTVCEIFREL